MYFKSSIRSGEISAFSIWSSHHKIFENKVLRRDRRICGILDVPFFSKKWKNEAMNQIYDIPSKVQNVVKMTRKSAKRKILEHKTKKELK